MQQSVDNDNNAGNTPVTDSCATDTEMPQPIDDTDTASCNQGLYTNLPPVMQGELPLMNNLLAYAVFSKQNCAINDIKHAILGHYTEDDIKKAMDLLWERAGYGELVERPRCRCDHNRSKKDMYCQDLLDALNKLDKSMKMPRIGIDALELAFIPRSMPAELNNMSLADRLGKIERLMEDMKQRFDDSTKDNIALRTRVAQIESMPNNRTSYAAALIPGRDTESAVRLRPAATTDCAAVTCDNLHLMPSITNEARTDEVIATANRSVDIPCTAVSDMASREYDDGFQMPRHALRRQASQRVMDSRPNKSCVIIGAKSDVRKFHGAPEPSRYLFIYRVHPDATTEDLGPYIANMDVQIGELSCISNENAMYKSFKLTTKLSQFKELLKADI